MAIVVKVAEACLSLSLSACVHEVGEETGFQTLSATRIPKSKRSSEKIGLQLFSELVLRLKAEEVHLSRMRRPAPANRKPADELTEKGEGEAKGGGGIFALIAGVQQTSRRRPA